LFKLNANIVKGLVEAVAKYSPSACIAIITNPVNTMVPLAAEVLKKAGCYDPKRLFGVTMLDTLRAETFWAEATNTDCRSTRIPVIGGHSGTTILPLFSQAAGYSAISAEQIEKLTVHVQNAGTEVVEAKGSGSATLSMAAAGARFALAIVRGLNGEADVVEPAYVASQSGYADFFAQPIVLGKEGLKDYLPIGKLSDYEEKALNGMLETLRKDIKQGVDFING
jgi:malate dehydrogenase